MISLPDLYASQSPTAVGMSVPVWLDLAAVVVGSFSGLFYARERKLDLVGYVALAILCGLGGGLVRDTIMQVGDVYLLRSNWAILFCILTGIVGFFFPAIITARPQLMEWVDIVSVGLFAAAGTDKAIVYQLHPTAIVFMGVITGVGGGMMRDVFLGEVPRIFRPSNWYALCAVAGSLAYYLLVVPVGLNKVWGTIICILITVLLRRMSLRYNIVSTSDVDLGPSLKKAAHEVAHAAKEATDNEIDHALKQHERQTERHEIPPSRRTR